MKSFCNRMVALMSFVACLSINVSAETQANYQLDKDGARTAQQSVAAAVSFDEYRFETGDKISIRVSGEPDMDVSVRLGTSGNIRYPFLGNIHILGMTPAELERKISSSLANGYLINPQVHVLIEEFRSFYAKGEVVKPGAYPYVPDLTVRKAISLAGGLTENADENRMFLAHAGAESKAGLDQKMQSGDVLTVVKQTEKRETVKRGAATVKSVDEYRLDAGDKIKIEVFGEPNLDVSVSIGSSGDIAYPFLGKIHVSGMTPRELQQMIARDLAKGYLSDPQVRVTIDTFRPFYASGEVKRPGAYPYQPGLTVNKAISLAGGFTEKADQNKVFIDHAGESRKKAGLDQNIRPGDILTVKQSFFYVNGEVRRPGEYPYQPNMTRRTAISVAGGFNATADESNVSLIQVGDTEAKSNIALDDEIQPGDILTVIESFFYVFGEVSKPGKYIYKPGMTYRMAISMAGGMKERADEDKVFVIHKGGQENRKLRNIDAEEVRSGDMITIKESFF